MSITIVIYLGASSDKSKNLYKICNCKFDILIFSCMNRIMTLNWERLGQMGLMHESMLLVSLCLVFATFISKS